jgi:hypothetical protein
MSWKAMRRTDPENAESPTKPTGTHTLISKNLTLTVLHPRERHHELHGCQREPGRDYR